MADAPSVGIMAYGSLIDEPGAELAPLILRTIRQVTTPFPVEFARKSTSRGDAPTLVPHATGVAVQAAILVVDASAEKATDMLWRRETRISDVSRRYPGPRPGNPKAVNVVSISDVAGIDVILYTSIGANIDPLTPDHLAELAIASVKTAKPGMDGISYLMSATANGIVTPLSEAYAAAILAQTGAADLAAARAQLAG